MTAQRDVLLYAAVMCVAKWAEVKQAAAHAPQASGEELTAAEAAVAAARAQGEATRERLEKAMLRDGVPPFIAPV